MSSAQPASRPTTDSPVAVPIRKASPSGFTFMYGYYDPDSSSYDDDVARDTARRIDALDATDEVLELVPA
jgi:hypothetical protein